MTPHTRRHDSGRCHDQHHREKNQTADLHAQYHVRTGSGAAMSDVQALSHPSEQVSAHRPAPRYLGGRSSVERPDHHAGLGSLVVQRLPVLIPEREEIVQVWKPAEGEVEQGQRGSEEKRPAAPACG